jgi:Coenzyme PQQ synthesis protein D (PqqD)
VTKPAAVKPAPNVVFQEVEGETVLLDLDSAHYYVLDDVGTRIWQLLTEHGDVEQVVSSMLAEFDVDEATLRTDLEALVARLTAAGLVVAP